MSENLHVGDIFIDDTPMDFSDVEAMSDEELNAYWERWKKELKGSAAGH